MKKRNQLGSGKLGIIKAYRITKKLYEEFTRRIATGKCLEIQRKAEYKEIEMLKEKL